MRKRRRFLSLAVALGVLTVVASFLVAGARHLFAEAPQTKVFTVTTPFALQVGETLAVTINTTRSDPYKNVISEGEPVARLEGRFFTYTGAPVPGPGGEFMATLVQGPGPLSNTFTTTFMSTAGSCFDIYVRLKARPGVRPHTAIAIIGPAGETRAWETTLGDGVVTD